MVLQKLENFRNKDIVKEEAEILTDLLDDITKNLVCPETFEKISQLKDLSKTKNYRDLNQLVEQLSNEEMTVISRYFAILPLLINISEDVDLAYEIKDYKKGYYVVVDATCTAADVAEFERLSNINASMLRHLTLRK